jgi:hypothetical protein
MVGNSILVIPVVLFGSYNIDLYAENGVSNYFNSLEDRGLATKFTPT